MTNNMDHNHPKPPCRRTTQHSFMLVIALVMLGWQGYLFHLQAATIGSFRGYEWPSLWPAFVAAAALILLVRSIRRYQAAVRSAKWVRRDGRRLP